jgi:cytochrome c-type biogenesis protein CcmH/NrfG
MLLAELQDLSARPPVLDAQTMKDAAGMSADDQQAMIRSMVDGLEERLATSPDDLAGWLRLIRARGVLGETDKARAAYDRAKSQFAGNADALDSAASPCWGLRPGLFSMRSPAPSLSSIHRAI